MLVGTTATGAIWTSCSPDFGPQAVADRFQRVSFKVLFVVNGYVSKGVPVSMAEKVEELVESLPSLEKIVNLELLQDSNKPVLRSPKVSEIMVTYEEFLQSANTDDGNALSPEYIPIPFANPQFVLYSSGTTGLPKSIAHGAGNTLFEHAKRIGVTF